MIVAELKMKQDKTILYFRLRNGLKPRLHLVYSPNQVTRLYKEVKMNEDIYNFRVGELIKILQQFPEDMPVVVSGDDNGF